MRQSGARKFFRAIISKKIIIETAKLTRNSTGVNTKKEGMKFRDKSGLKMGFDHYE